jgi:hypothetical protein
MELDIVDDTVRSVCTVVNPDKLRHLGPLSDVLRSTGIRGQAPRTPNF